MKNLPDQELWNAISKRLGQYTEEPDEKIWRGISGSLRKHREPRWPVFLNRVTLGLVIILFTYLMFGSLKNSSVNDASIGVINSDTNKSPANASKSVGRTPTEREKGVDPNLSSNAIAPQGGHTVDLLSERKETLLKSEDEPALNEYDKLAIERKEDVNLTTGIVTKDHKIDSINKVSHDNVKQSVEESLDKEAETIAESTVVKKRGRKLMFYGMITPLLTYQQVQPLHHDNVEINGLISPSVLSMDRFAFTLEAGVQGRFSRKMEYYTGVSYYRQRQTLYYTYLSGDHVSVVPDGDLNYDIRPAYDQGEVNYSMNNVGVQAGVLYTLISRQLMHKLGAGLVYQQGSINSDAEQPYNNSKSSYLLYQILYRNEIAFNSSVGVFFQPVFQYTIFMREDLNAPFKLKPYRAGFSFGVTYRF